MRNLVERIAGVGFRLALTLVDDDSAAPEIVPTDYNWTLRGKRGDAASEADPVAFELTTDGGHITVVNGEVVCAFSAGATEDLAGIYRAQLIGSVSGAAAIGGELEPLLFTARF